MDSSNIDLRAMLLPLSSRRSSNEEQQQYSRQRDSDMENEETEDHGCDVIPNLTWNERLIGFVTCLMFGYVLSFGSFFRIKELILGNPGMLSKHILKKGNYNQRSQHQTQQAIN